MHGSQARAYLGGRDVSGDLGEISVASLVDLNESTTFISGSHQNEPGLYRWEAELTGFYDPSVGGIGRQFESLLGANGGILSVYDGLAAAIGTTGTLLSDGILTKRGEPIEVAELIKLSGTLTPSAPSGGARAGFYGVLLHVLGIESVTGNSTSVDGLASSALGGRANLHITAGTGTGGVIRVEDSANNSTWATIATFATASASGAQTIDIAGTIRQYVRAAWVMNGSSSLTFALGIARYT